MLSPVFRPDAEVLEILCAFGRCDMREAINGALRWESEAIMMTLHRSFNVSWVPASQGSVEAGACPILSFGLQVFLRRYQGLLWKDAVRPASRLGWSEGSRTD